MEGLCISCSSAAYDVVVVGKHFNYYIGASPNTILEREFHRLVVCFRVKNVAVVVNFERCGGRFLVVVSLVFKIGLHEIGFCGLVYFCYLFL